MIELSSRSLTTALLLLSRERLPEWEAWPQTAKELLELTGASRTQAYEMLGRLRAVVPTLLGTPGRPAAEPTAPTAYTDVVVAVRNFLLQNPGSACYIGERYTYSDEYRRFIVGLVSPGNAGEGMSLEELSKASSVPLGTIKDWLSRKTRFESACIDHQVPAQNESAVQAANKLNNESTEEETIKLIRNAHLRLIARLWPKWQASFKEFCVMIRGDQRIPYSDSFIGNFLQSIGLRQRKKRSPAEAPWSGEFRALFPGVQWLGDGTTVALRMSGRMFIFNIEAIMDTASNAVVGFDVSDTESEEALRRTYEAAVGTTAAPPLCITLDNKPCNLSPGAKEAVGAHSSRLEAYACSTFYIASTVGLSMLGGALLRFVWKPRLGTIFLRATPGRGQAKAALEGAFGLFRQSLPPLEVKGGSLREMARSILHLVFTAWFRGRNGRPRKRLNGLSPTDAYTQARPTAEEIREAMEWIRELLIREERARRTREARRDPARIELLKRGLQELGIPDPNNRLATSLAYFCREAIAEGLATFTSKKELGTLPATADHHGAYLGGIIRQIDTRLELERISEHYLKQRIRLNDISLRHLELAATTIRSTFPQAGLPQAFVDRALRATYAIDFTYWAGTAARSLENLDPHRRPATYNSLCRRIANTFKAPKVRRQRLICLLADATAMPVAA
jgi:transposase InsO family protein